MKPWDLSAGPLRRYHINAFDSDRWDGFEFRDDDILICTAYKSGTTWMQMICALLIFQTPEFDRRLTEISPWLDLRAERTAAVHAALAAQTHRRFIKTHTPLDGLPWSDQVDYIFVARDPRDVFVSMYNQIRNSNPDAGGYFNDEEDERDPARDIEDPDELFAHWLSHGQFDWEEDGAPYWSMLRHTQTFWVHRNRPNIHLIHYADLTADLAGQMQRLAQDLGVDIDPDRIPGLAKAAQIGAMRQRADQLAPDANLNMWKDNRAFFRAGGAGGWRDMLSEDSARLFAEVTAARYPSDMMHWVTEGGIVPPG
jgi:hypothetical protein